MKNNVLIIILLIFLAISIPISLLLSMAVGATMKYETELGQFPSYIDPSEIPANPEAQKAFLDEIHNSLLFQYHLLRIWWIPAGFLLVIVFFYLVKRSNEDGL